MNFSLLSDRRRVLLLLNLLSGGGKGISVSGTSPITLANAVKGKLKKLLQYGKVSVTDGVITCNNGVLVLEHRSGLPRGYKLLDCVGGSGSQYVITDIYLASTDVVECEFRNSSTTGYGAIYGIYNTAESSALYGNKTYYGYTSANNKVDTDVNVNTKWHFSRHDFVNGTLTVDDTTVSFTPWEFVNSNKNAVMSRFYNGSYGYNWNGYIRKFKVTRGNEIVCDLLPCKNDQDVAGLYDLISQTFYAPTGGDLLEGNEVDDYVVATDGTPEVITLTDADSNIQTATAPNLYAVEDIVDEVDIISGKVTRRTEAVVSDGTTPSGRYVGTVGEGNVIVQARETVYEDDAVVTFTAEEETPLNLVKAEFSPVQDLHGYDAPWPAGGGSNIFDGEMTSGGIDAGSGAEFANPDASTWFSTNFIPVDPLKTYIAVVDGITSHPLLRARFYDSDKAYIGYVDSQGNQISFRTAFTPPANAAYMKMNPNKADVPMTAKVAVNYPSTVTTYSPYKNECPISGWTGVEIDRTAETYPLESGSIADSTGEEVEANTRIRTGYIEVSSLSSIDLLGKDSDEKLRAIHYYNSDKVRIGYKSNAYGVDIPKTSDFGEPAQPYAYIRLVFQHNPNTLPESPTGKNAVVNYETIPITWQTEAGTVYGGQLKIYRDGSADLVGEKASKNFVANPGALVIGTSGAGIKYADLYYTTFGETLGVDVPILTSAYKQINSAATGRDCTIITYTSAFTIYDNRFTDASTASGILADVQCVYPLATPVTYHLPSIDALKSFDGVNNVWHSANGKITVALADADVIEQNTPHAITLTEGTNTITVTANVEGIQFDVLYKGNQPEESAPLNSFSSSSFSGLNNPFNPGLSTMDTEPEDIPLDDQAGDLEDLQEEPEASDIDA